MQTENRHLEVEHQELNLAIKHADERNEKLRALLKEKMEEEHAHATRLEEIKSTPVEREEPEQPTLSPLTGEVMFQRVDEGAFNPALQEGEVSPDMGEPMDAKAGTSEDEEATEI